MLVALGTLETHPKQDEATKVGYHFVVKRDGVRLEAVPVEDGDWEGCSAPEGSSPLQEWVRQLMQIIVHEPFLLEPS